VTKIILLSSTNRTKKDTASAGRSRQGKFLKISNYDWNFVHRNLDRKTGHRHL
jgi:hypothetical protein